PDSWMRCVSHQRPRIVSGSPHRARRCPTQVVNVNCTWTCRSTASTFTGSAWETSAIVSWLDRNRAGTSAFSRSATATTGSGPDRACRIARDTRTRPATASSSAGSSFANASTDRRNVTTHCEQRSPSTVARWQRGHGTSVTRAPVHARALQRAARPARAASASMHTRTSSGPRPSRYRPAPATLGSAAPPRRIRPDRSRCRLGRVDDAEHRQHLLELLVAGAEPGSLPADVPFGRDLLLGGAAYGDDEPAALERRLVRHQSSTSIASVIDRSARA